MSRYIANSCTALIYTPSTLAPGSLAMSESRLFIPLANHPTAAASHCQATSANVPRAHNGDNTKSSMLIYIIKVVSGTATMLARIK